MLSWYSEYWPHTTCHIALSIGRGMLLLCLNSFCSLRLLSVALHRFWSAQHNIAGRKALLVLEWPSFCTSLVWGTCLHATIS